jgi:hypothetical protein
MGAVLTCGSCLWFSPACHQGTFFLLLFDAFLFVSNITKVPAGLEWLCHPWLLRALEHLNSGMVSRP